MPGLPPRWAGAASFGRCLLLHLRTCAIVFTCTHTGWPRLLPPSVARRQCSRLHVRVAGESYSPCVATALGPRAFARPLHAKDMCHPPPPPLPQQTGCGGHKKREMVSHTHTHTHTLPIHVHVHTHTTHTHTRTHTHTQVVEGIISADWSAYGWWLMLPFLPEHHTHPDMRAHTHTLPIHTRVHRWLRASSM